MGRLAPRLLGLMLLACSGGSTLVHRGVYEANRHGPPRPAEFGLALLTIILASTGILLLIHGARLFKSANRLDRSAFRVETAARPCFEDPITPVRAFDTRHGASMMQARHQIGLSRSARTMIGTNASKHHRAVFDPALPPQR